MQESITNRIQELTWLVVKGHPLKIVQEPEISSYKPEYIYLKMKCIKLSGNKRIIQLRPEDDLVFISQKKLIYFTVCEKLDKCMDLSIIHP